MSKIMLASYSLSARKPPHLAQTHLPLLFLNICFDQGHGVGFLANIYFSVLKPWESKIKLLSWCCWEASSGIQIELLYDSLQGREKGAITLLQRKWSHSWVLFPDDLIASDSFHLQISHQVKTSALLYVWNWRTNMSFWKYINRGTTILTLIGKER